MKLLLALLVICVVGLFTSASRTAASPAVESSPTTSARAVEDPPDEPVPQIGCFGTSPCCEYWNGKCLTHAVCISGSWYCP